MRALDYDIARRFSGRDCAMDPGQATEDINQTDGWRNGMRIAKLHIVTRICICFAAD